MSKGQRGNKEAKKPKKLPAPIQPPATAEPAPVVTTKAAPRPGK
jgi:hypothetical protein